jgi:hypothetical protein
MESYTINDEQWQQVMAALNVATSVCLMHKREFMEQMVDAALVMDEVVNGKDEDGE